MIAKDKFEEGIKNMRSLLINRYDYVRSTMIFRTSREFYLKSLTFSSKYVQLYMEIEWQILSKHSPLNLKVAY